MTTNIWKNPLIVRVAAIVLGVFLAMPALAFTEPSDAPPGGTTAAPLNVSSTTQTKTGKLILQGGLELNSGGTAVFGVPIDFRETVNFSDATKNFVLLGKLNIATPSPTTGSLNIASAASPRDICWNGVCKSDWPSGAGLRTGAAPQINYALGSQTWSTLFDTGFLAVQADHNWALGGAARDIPDDPVTGIENFSTGILGSSAANRARSGHTLQFDSSGVLGIARLDGDRYIGVQGRTLGNSALAGYFLGRLVANQVDSTGTNLNPDKGGSNDVVGIYGNHASGSALYAEQNGTGYAGYFSGRVNVQGSLCISGDCKSAWPAAAGPGTTYFDRQAANGVVYPSNLGDRIGIGGGGFTAPIYLDPTFGGTVSIGPFAGGRPRPGGDHDVGAAGASSDSLSRFGIQAAQASITPGVIDRIQVRNGVISIHNDGFGGDALELGNAGRDITGSGVIYVRPSAVAAAQAVQIVESGTRAKLMVPLGSVTGSLAVGQASATAKLAVSNNLNDAGSANDAIAAYANTAGSSLYAQQSGTGYAGYFSGRVNITGSLCFGGTGCRTGWPTLGDLGGIGGTGATNYLPKWTAASALGNSQIFDNGTVVGINNSSATGARLIVNQSGASGSGRVGDAIAAVTDSTDNAIYAQQLNAGGKAALFEGGVFVQGDADADASTPFQISGNLRRFTASHPRPQYFKLGGANTGLEWRFYEAEGWTESAGCIDSHPGVGGAVSGNAVRFINCGAGTSYGSLAENYLLPVAGNYHIVIRAMTDDIAGGGTINLNLRELDTGGSPLTITFTIDPDGTWVNNRWKDVVLNYDGSLNGRFGMNFSTTAMGMTMWIDSIRFMPTS